MLDKDRWDALRGMLAGGVAAELADPLARVQAALAAAVDTMDKHVGKAKGPEPLPASMMALVREHLADAYLELGRAVRLAADLASVTTTGGSISIDPNDLVERAISLARHRTGPVRLDLGTVPWVKCDPARLTPAIAALLVEVAGFARAPVEVQTRHTYGLVSIAVLSVKPAEGELVVPALIGGVLAELGGEIAVMHDDARLRVELRIAVVP